jgi:hypothetical protein
MSEIVKSAKIVKLVTEKNQRGRWVLTAEGRKRARSLLPPSPGLLFRGRIAAGPALPLLDDTEEYIALPNFNPATHFVLKAQGDSMVGYGIMDGDLVVIRKVASWLDVPEGTIVAALVPEGTGAEGDDWLDRLPSALDDIGMQPPALDHVTLKRFDRRFRSYMGAGNDPERTVALLRGSSATYSPLAVAVIGIAVHRFGGL